MIKQLRQRLIIASMLSLFIVLFVIMASIGIFNYRHLLEQADNTLEILAENNGTFPRMDGSEGIDGRKQNIPSELPYESRYFSVVMNSSEIVISVDTNKIAAVNSGKAVEYALKALESEKQRGFVSDYRYVLDSSSDSVRIIFLDLGRQLETFKSFVFSAITISFLGMLVVFLLIKFLSERIVKPVSESYEKQKRFITDAGHEIKTPITIIDADSQILEMDLGENEWLKDIQNQSKRLTSLSNDLTLLARMDEEQVHVEKIDFLISDLVEDVAQSFRSKSKIESKSFEINIEPMVSINGDEKSIRQLISILLDNAFKYTNENGLVALNLYKKGKLVNIVVENSTEFISRESTNYLFDRFYRTDTSRNSKTGGYGLGLSIAMAIVNMHKGKIKATTKDEKSLTITIQLPTI